MGRGLVTSGFGVGDHGDEYCNGKFISKHPIHKNLQHHRRISTSTDEDDDDDRSRQQTSHNHLCRVISPAVDERQATLRHQTPHRRSTLGTLCKQHTYMVGIQSVSPRNSSDDVLVNSR